MVERTKRPTTSRVLYIYADRDPVILLRNPGAWEGYTLRTLAPGTPFSSTSTTTVNNAHTIQRQRPFSIILAISCSDRLLGDTTVVYARFSV